MQAYVGGLAQLPAPADQPLFHPPQSKKAKRKGLLNLAKGGKAVVQNVMKGVGLTPGMHRDETKPLVRCRKHQDTSTLLMQTCSGSTVCRRSNCRIHMRRRVRMRWTRLALLLPLPKGAPLVRAVQDSK